MRFTETKHSLVSLVGLLELGYPLLPDVDEGRRRHHREADEEDVGVGVAQRAERVEIVLSRKRTRFNA